MRHGVIAGVFRNKGAAPWAITRAVKLQRSVFLANDLSLDDWYARVYAASDERPLVTLGTNVLGYSQHSTDGMY